RGHLFLLRRHREDRRRVEGPRGGIHRAGRGPRLRVRDSLQGAGGIRDPVVPTPVHEAGRQEEVVSLPNRHMSQATTTSPMSGSFRLFRLGGISVHLHWSWLLIAVISLRFRTNEYHSQAWAVAEYLSLFAIVLIHEFGHALACRSVGGRADHIVLWPLGGIAF